MNGVIRGRCPRCGGKIIYSEFYQNARDYTIRKDGKVPKRYVSRSGELSESVAACENGCGAYWEDEDFSIGQDGMFYDNKYTEDFIVAIQPVDSAEKLFFTVKTR